MPAGYFCSLIPHIFRAAATLAVEKKNAWRIYENVPFVTFSAYFLDIAREMQSRIWIVREKNVVKVISDQNIPACNANKTKLVIILTYQQHNTQRTELISKFTPWHCFFADLLFE